MNITLKSGENLDQYIATNEDGQSITLSGDGSAVGPMQAVLMAAAGCSTIDVVMILKKMRQKLVRIEVETKGNRREEIPKIYTAIHLHYKLYGQVKENKAEDAIRLSVEKYCSVSKMLELAAEISTSFEIIPE
ncbi:MAG: OsmC family protein [Bacteroidota bacterium]